MRVDYTSGNDPGANGTYFQQRALGDPFWDFWAGLRNAADWNDDVDVDPWVTDYGIDFVLTRSPLMFDSGTNLVTHAPEGDTEFGFWGTTTHTLNDLSVLTVSRHAGLLGDGVGGEDWMWWATLMPADGRLKNDPSSNSCVIWLR